MARQIDTYLVRILLYFPGERVDGLNMVTGAGAQKLVGDTSLPHVLGTAEDGYMELRNKCCTLF